MKVGERIERVNAGTTYVVTARAPHMSTQRQLYIPAQMNSPGSVDRAIDDRICLKTVGKLASSSLAEKSVPNNWPSLVATE